MRPLFFNFAQDLLQCGSGSCPTPRGGSLIQCYLHQGKELQSRNHTNERADLRQLSEGNNPTQTSLLASAQG